uniref:PH domain-containing protein n=1 Tax=Natrinema halophilum TaxID=1699371 RepID=A0A7D5KDU7_9EURY
MTDLSTLVIVFLFLIVGTMLAVLRFRRFRYEIRKDGIHLRQGVVTIRDTFVPADKIQHIDINHSLLGRPFGLVSLRIHTAGVFDGQITIPGLDSDRATALSNQLNQLTDDGKSV